MASSPQSAPASQREPEKRLNPKPVEKPEGQKPRFVITLTTMVPG
jgi:hypothetical protein